MLPRMFWFRLRVEEGNLQKRQKNWTESRHNQNIVQSYTLVHVTLFYMNAFTLLVDPKQICASVGFMVRVILTF